MNRKRLNAAAAALVVVAVVGAALSNPTILNGLTEGNIMWLIGQLWPPLFAVGVAAGVVLYATQQPPNGE